MSIESSRHLTAKQTSYAIRLVRRHERAFFEARLAEIFDDPEFEDLDIRTALCLLSRTWAKREREYDAIETQYARMVLRRVTTAASYASAWASVSELKWLEGDDG